MASTQSFIHSSSLIFLVWDFEFQNRSFTRPAKKIWSHSSSLFLKTLSFLCCQVRKKEAALALDQNHPAWDVCHLCFLYSTIQSPMLLGKTFCIPKPLQNSFHMFTAKSHDGNKWSMVSPWLWHNTHLQSLSGKIPLILTLVWSALLPTSHKNFTLAGILPSQMILKGSCSFHLAEDTLLHRPL